MAGEGEGEEFSERFSASLSVITMLIKVYLLSVAGTVFYILPTAAS